MPEDAQTTERTSLPSPSADVPRIRGLTPADIYVGLQRDHRMACDGPNRSIPYLTWTCKRSGNPDRVVVYAPGRDPRAVSQIEATVSSMDGRALLGDIAGASFDGADPDAARRWVDEHYDTASQGHPTTMVIHGVTYTLSVNDVTRILRIGQLG